LVMFQIIAQPSSLQCLANTKKATGQLCNFIQFEIDNIVTISKTKYPATSG
jgi:hypothetical protein